VREKAEGQKIRPVREREAAPGKAITGRRMELVELALMGQNLALNMAHHGLRMTVYNRTSAVM
jgi:hypothetical protein